MNRQGPQAARVRSFAAVRRRKAAFAIGLVCAAAALAAAAWAAAAAVRGASTPSLVSVAALTDLHYPASTEVTEADLTELHTPASGSVGEVTVTVPAEDFADFIDGNDMAAPLPSGAAPNGEAIGIIPSGCGERSCYSASFLVEDGTVTIDLTVTLR